MTKLLEKHSVNIRRATTKYKHTHAAFVEAFNRELAKLLLKPMDTQELQNPEKVSKIWVKILNKVVINIQKKPYYPRMDYIDTFINPVNNMETKKAEQQILFGVKIGID